MKDAFGLGAFLVLYAWMTFFVPNYLGHPDNYIEANPLVTPPHIVPEWYFLPFYAILRAIPNKLLGVIALFLSIAIAAMLPWLDRSKVKSGSHRPLFRKFYWVFVAVCVGLGYLGAQPAEGVYLWSARILAFYYFLHYVIVLPFLAKYEKTEPVPDSIADAVAAKGGASHA
jgi:ubiquinol-cytochrome c reductase cytochrome b subunit